MRICLHEIGYAHLISCLLKGPKRPSSYTSSYKSTSMSQRYSNWCKDHAGSVMIGFSRKKAVCYAGVAPAVDVKQVMKRSKFQRKLPSEFHALSFEVKVGSVVHWPISGYCQDQPEF